MLYSPGCTGRVGKPPEGILLGTRWRTCSRNHIITSFRDTHLSWESKWKKTNLVDSMFTNFWHLLKLALKGLYAQWKLIIWPWLITNHVFNKQQCKNCSQRDLTWACWQVIHKRTAWSWQVGWQQAEQVLVVFLFPFHPQTTHLFSFVVAEMVKRHRHYCTHQYGVVIAPNLLGSPIFQLMARSRNAHTLPVRCLSRLRWRVTPRQSETWKAGEQSSAPQHHTAPRHVTSDVVKTLTRHHKHRHTTS